MSPASRLARKVGAETIGTFALAAIGCVACGDAEAAIVDDAGVAAEAGAVVDTGVDAAAYGDGVRTEDEFEFGLEAIEKSRGLARSGPNAVTVYIDMHRMRLDGIWEDCVDRFCPIAIQITNDCLVQFTSADAGVDDDAGAGWLPSCYDLPADCVDFDGGA